MEAQEVGQVFNEIVAHIELYDNRYPNWYCGIASDWVSRLFEDHQVPREGHPYIARQCYNDGDARTVESALIKLGCDGAPGGGDETTIYVYAYLKGTMTNP
jgi:hypothetical protein